MKYWVTFLFADIFFCNAAASLASASTSVPVPALIELSVFSTLYFLYNRSIILSCSCLSAADGGETEHGEGVGESMRGEGRGLDFASTGKGGA